MVVPKKSLWNMIFLVFLGKMIFLYPENMILPPRRKMKDNLSQKNTREFDIFFQCSEKMVFPKSTAPGHDLSCIIWKDGVFFPKNMIFFPWTENETHGYMIFSVYTYRCYGRGATPLCQKKIKDDLIP